MNARLGFAALLLAGMLTACPPPQPIQVIAPGASAEEEGAQQYVLKTYTLPEGHIPQVVRTLEELHLGRVVRGPGGQLYVMATPQQHPGIAELIEAAKEMPAPEVGGPVSIQIDYWMVLGLPTEGEASRSPGLEAVSSALDEIVARDGAMDFKMENRMSLLSQEDWPGEAASGSGFSVSQTADYDEGTGVVRGTIGVGGGRYGKIDTTVQLTPGQFLVLGAGMSPIGPGTGSAYFIVRPEVIPAK